jgi:CRP/FNR family transcriptional regulator, cyclic AMP receptor protein
MMRQKTDNNPASLYSRLLEGFRGKPKSSVPQKHDAGVWVVTDTNWSNTIQPDNMREMGAICPPRPYRKGELIYRPGDPAESLFIVLEGNVKLSMQGSTSSEAVCLADRTVVCPISRSQFLEVSQRVPGVALLFATVLVARVQRLELQLELMASPAQARLGRCLLLLTKRFGTEIKPGILNLNIGLKHEDLASLAATTRVSATQAISVWRTQGLIEGTRGEYQIRMEAFETMIERLEQERL